MIGKIKQIVRDRYYGFVSIGGEGRYLEFFFHATNAPGFEQLQRGDPVEFWLDDDPYRNGLRAVDVRRIEP